MCNGESGKCHSVYSGVRACVLQIIQTSCSRTAFILGSFGRSTRLVRLSVNSFGMSCDPDDEKHVLFAIFGRFREKTAQDIEVTSNDGQVLGELVWDFERH